MPLDGFSNTAYTGLVGETGAMSSGEMFMAGGSVGNFDVKLLVGKRVVYEAKVDTLKKAQRIGSEILSWEDDGFEYTIIGYDSSNNKIFENKRLLSDEFPAKLKDKFATLQLNVIVANPKQNKLDAGSFTTYRALLNIVDDFEEANFRVTINGKTFYEDDYELGGVMATDLAGHTGGGDSGLNAGMPLDGFSNTAYTGLVGETGAMSSGEMFMAGGSVSTSDLNDLLNRINQESEANFSIGGAYGNYELWAKDKNGDEHRIEVGSRKDIKEALIKNRYNKKYTKYEAGGTLPDGVNQPYMITEALGNPAQHFAKGGGVRMINGKEYAYGRNWTNDHRHINKDEEHEVKYTRKGKFLGIFNDGGAIKNQYAGRTPEDVWENLTDDQKEHFLYDHQLSLDMDYEKYSYEDLPSKVKRKFREHIMDGEYNKGGALTNERKHVNHDEDYEVRYSKPRPKRKGYKGARKFMAGGSMESPRIYVADLEAYNNGRLVGEWLDLADYNDADELMDAIQDVLKKSGGEEYAIHDVEYVPRSLYSEYMSKNDFQALYEVMETAKRYDLPLEVVEEIVSQYGEGGVEEFYGKYDNAEDFAEQLVDDIGIESFNSYEYYMYVTYTDRRLIAQEQADFYVEGIADEDGGNRLIEEAGMDVDKYEEADSEMQEEMLDKARQIVYDDYYDTWYEGLDDPKNFLVDEQGIYDTESFANLSFVNVDYEKLARDLEQDYTFIEHDGELYVFNIR